jgi:acyl transferase domain-containing protein/acyl carrier protein
VTSSLQWADGIAIIGISARFPKSRNVDEYWRNIARGERLIGTLDDQQLREAGIDDTLFTSPTYVREGTKLDDAECFDAKFFGYSRREAEITDPQQRVFLECAWEALEDSGNTAEAGRIGVYASIGMNSYLLSQIANNPEVVAAAGGYQLMLGNDKDYLATRVAYKMNLSGPAIVIQSACSSSLAAVHFACRSILTGECDMALAGGVSIPFPQATGYQYIPGMILSPDGFCRPFDSRAHGTVPGCGSGVVVLKALTQALRDGDNIYAVIRGSACNNDGSAKIGYTAPGVEGQARAIELAQQAAGANPRSIAYVETHGTGTELGDPIEIAALTEAFRRGTADRGFCAIGSVKANMGHADTAAGVAGLIKCALSIQRGVIPPSPYFAKPNPALELESSPFYINSTAQQWPVGREKWAGVSSFGIGGTNVHVCLSEAPVVAEAPREKRDSILVISARTEAALERASENLAAHMESHSELAMQDVAYTLQTGRKAFDFRRAIVSRDALGAAAALRDKALSSRLLAAERAPKVVFLFPGQGEQFPAMANALYAKDENFRDTLDRGARQIESEFGLDLLSVICADKSSESARQLRETRFVQPALFLLEFALAKKWKELGVHPTAMIGHSLGELVAATIGGVFSFEEGLRLAAERGRLMGETPAGAMLAVPLTEEDLQLRLDGDLWIAAVNGPKVSVAAGTPGAVDKLEQELTRDGMRTVRLSSQHAFHTPMMAEAAQRFAEIVSKTVRREPSVPWLSNVTGTWITSADAVSPEYWAQQILRCARLSDSVLQIRRERQVFLEVGPGETLLGLVRQQISTTVGAGSIGSRHRVNDDHHSFLEAVGRLWQTGVEIDWKALHKGEHPRRVALPTYPFEREKFWVSAPQNASTQTARGREADGAISNLGKRADIGSWFYAPTWQRTPPPTFTDAPQQSLSARCWLVLLDQADGLGEKVARRLEQTGATVVRVKAGKSFAFESDCFSVGPTCAKDFEQLFDQLTARGILPTGLVNLWSMTSGSSAYEGLLHLVHAATSKRIRLQQVEIIASQLEQVSDEEIEPERSLICGLALLVPVEFVGVKCRVIDVQQNVGALDRIAAQLTDEFRVPLNNVVVAYRGAYRWVKGWEPVSLPSPEKDPLRMDGVYLITGGVGGIGFTLACHLARSYRARLILTARTPLPPRENWDEWLATHGSEDVLSRRIRRVLELEHTGAEVMVVAADVADREAMLEVLSQAEARFGTVNGVIHTAGTPGAGLISSQDRAFLAEAWRPKVEGTLVLASLFQSHKLDFFFLCSSISSVSATIGLSAYGSANSFLDHFAIWCREHYGLPALAVNFHAWQGVGMVEEIVSLPGYEQLKQARLEKAIRPDEGVEVFRRVLQWPGAQIVASPIEFREEFAAYNEQIAEIMEESADQDESSIGNDEADLLEVLAIWTEVLAVKDITASDNFFELGGHSLIGTMVLSRVRDRFEVVLTLRDLFEAATPRKFVERIRAAQSAVIPLETVPASEDREEFEL